MFKFLVNNFLQKSGISDELEYKHNIRMNYAHTITNKSSLLAEQNSVRKTLGGENSEGRLRLQTLREILKIYRDFKGLSNEDIKLKLSAMNDRNRKFHEAVLRIYKG